MAEANHKSILSIIIPTWNGRDMLYECLSSLDGAPASCPSEIIIVDNGSTDGTVEMLQRSFPEAKIIRNEKNLGFTVAVNSGLKIGSGRYFLVLNNDVIVLPQALDRLIEFMEENRDAGIAGCKLFYPGGKIQAACFKDRTLLSVMAEAFFIDRVLKNIAEFPVGAGNVSSEGIKIYPDWIMGAAMMIRREVIEKTGGFDEVSFTGDEDICFRARYFGWKIGFVPEAIMVHRHRQSSFPESGRLDSDWIGKMYFEFQRSGCLAFIRRNPLWKGRIFIFIKKAGAVLRLVAAILKFLFSIGDESREKARIKGHFSFLTFPFDGFKPFADTIPLQRITIIAPALSVRGGVSRQAGFLLNSSISEDYRINYLETHVTGNRFIKFLKALEAFSKFKISLLFNPPQLLIIYMSGDASFFRKSVFALMAYFWKVKTILYCHSFDIDHFYARSRDIVKKYMRFVLRKADRVIALSNHWKEGLSYISGRDDIAVVAPSSPDLELFIAEGKRRDYNNENSILFMGQLEERKGVFDLLEVFSGIYHDGNINVKLVLAGEGETKKVRNFIEKHHLEKNVELAGWVDGDRKKDIFKKNSIFVLPAYAEGFPLVLLEAMANGLAVVSADAGGIKDIINDGLNGFIIKPGDTPGLKRIILRLLESCEERKKMGMAAVETVEKSFLFSATEEGIKEEIKKMLNMNSERI